MQHLIGGHLARVLPQAEPVRGRHERLVVRVEAHGGDRLHHMGRLDDLQLRIRDDVPEAYLAVLRERHEDLAIRGHQRPSEDIRSN